MLLARSENKLWFIHQKPRASRSSQLLSRFPTMRARHLRIFVGPTCTFDPQQSEDKVQMTPAHRRIRFRCLRRSRRGLKKIKKLRRTIPAEPKPMNKTASMGWQKTVCVNIQNQHRLSRNTVNEKRIAKQTRHSPFEITPARVRNKRFSVRTDADAER